MASISSVGLGSGLDVKSIVSQLVALEKAPITTLQAKEAGIQTKISSFAQIKGLVSTFADAAAKLTRDSGFSAMTVNSSNASALSAAVSGVATPGNYSFTVSQLAQAQTSASSTVAAGTTLGTGTITLQVGSGAAKTITIGSGDDTSLTGIASRINDAAAGVTASVVTDSTGQRLVLRSTDTGSSSGFTVTASATPTTTTTPASTTTDADGNTVTTPASTTTTTPTTGLSSLSFSIKQPAQDTLAQINGVDVVSAKRTIADAVPGMTFTASQVTTTPVDVSVTADTATTKSNIQAFVDSYNAINDLLSTSVKYDSDSKTAGALQGDSTAVGLQNTLRSMVGAVAGGGGAFTRLSDIGISVLRGGNLSLDTTKLDKALSTTSSAADVKKLFAFQGATAADGGIAVKFKALTTAMLGFDGTFNTKSDSLALEDKRNLADQDKITARAAALEARLNAQYTALDTKMASLNSLSAYVTQQVTNWNKSS